jgi:hypothetical protein
MHRVSFHALLLPHLQPVVQGEIMELSFTSRPKKPLFGGLMPHPSEGMDKDNSRTSEWNETWKGEHGQDSTEALIPAQSHYLGPHFTAHFG